MNKTAIKNFAIWARRKLISDITYKAGMLGVSENGIAQPLPQSTRDLQFFDIGTKDYTEVSGIAIEQRNALVSAIRTKEASSDYRTAFRSVVEEVAYTWFNRLIAARFMEVNDYLPSHIRVLSSENAGKLEPDFVTTPFDTDLEFTPFEQDQVYQLKDENKLDDLFRMLFIKQCNKLNEILPGLFEQISDYTELLLNISFTDKDGIVYHLTHDISEDEFNVEKEGQVEIIGWMYQYYNTEPKDEVFALLKKNVKITKERIPAATQLFTPDWIVRYMVENSLGRLWVEGHPNDSLKGNWKYYLEEAEQVPDVVEQLKKIRDEYAKLSPTDIKVIDPCMGSGHILVYAFDVLMQIYASQGYVEREAAKSILVNNLYGIDIDVRAYQLAYFAVMMKARQYNRKIFSEEIRPNLIAIRNPRDISVSVLKKLGGLEPVGLRLVEEFQDAEEYGSIMQPNVTLDELDRLDKRLEEIREEAEYGNLLERTEAVECLKLMKPLVKQGRLLVQKYDVVVTNPPYMGASGMADKLSLFVKNKYPDSRSDLSTVCMERCLAMCSADGLMAMINIPVWMFLSTYEELRGKLNKNNTYINMVHPGRGIFGSDFGTVTFVIEKKRIAGYKGLYCRLFKRQGEVDSVEERELTFLSGVGRFVAKQENYIKIPGMPVAYWVSDRLLYDYSVGERLDTIAHPKQGIKTADKDRFLRFWHEVSILRTSLSDGDVEKWFPCNKGGSFRKWYGNNEYVVNWENDGYEICNYRDDKGRLKSRPQNLQYMLLEGITYTNISISSFGARYSPEGFIYDAAGSGIFCEDAKHIPYVLGFLTSSVAAEITKITSPSMAFEVGQIGSLPFIFQPSNKIDEIVKENIRLSKGDWDSFETSWDFIRHPLVFDLKLKEEYKNSQWVADRLSKCSSLSWHYEVWASECEHRFQQLKSNEEELNRIFIDIYGLQDELTPDVEDKDVTVRKADLGREIRSLISYAVGCMFGRYSLDVPGLAYAGGVWNASQYSSFVPDADNCIPIMDEEYFTDDIVGRFVEFVRSAYGPDALEENLDFVAAALGNKGNTSREVIRNYFLNDFYKDHLKIYQKRPIYWLFDSGKQNGFKALVYMHRWNADTVGNLRIEYLHKMQNVYEHEINTCQEMIDHGSGHDVAVDTKRKEKLVKQLKECKDYDALVAHIAFSKINIDLDDGVKVNYRKVQTGADGKFCEILANSKDIMAKE